MKCPKCGEEMYSAGYGGFDTGRGNYVDIKYVCPKCGYEAKAVTEGVIGNFVPEYQYKNYGWICPKCGAVLSPSTKECPYCTPYKVTCGTISGITTTQTLKSSSLTSPDKITVTGNNITLQAQTETKVQSKSEDEVVTIKPKGDKILVFDKINKIYDDYFIEEKDNEVSDI